MNQRHFSGAHNWTAEEFSPIAHTRVVVGQQTSKDLFLIVSNLDLIAKNWKANTNFHFELVDELRNFNSGNFKTISLYSHVSLIFWILFARNSFYGFTRSSSFMQLALSVYFLARYKLFIENKKTRIANFPSFFFLSEMKTRSAPLGWFAFNRAANTLASLCGDIFISLETERNIVT